MHACRYCGLFEESLAAHAEARRLDPNIATSFEQTLLLTGDIDRLVATLNPAPDPAPTTGILVIGLGIAGRRERSAPRARADEGAAADSVVQALDRTAVARGSTRHAGRCSSSRSAGTASSRILEDPEAIFQDGWLLCDVGEHERGLPYLERALATRLLSPRRRSCAPAVRRAPRHAGIRVARRRRRGRPSARARGVP